MYLAYEITEESRQKLLNMFMPKYPDVLCHHITYQYPAKWTDAVPDMPSRCCVIGYANDPVGIEALVAQIDGNIVRPDNQIFHITVSLDRKAGKKPLHSNSLLQSGFTFLDKIEEIYVTPKFIS